MFFQIEGGIFNDKTMVFDSHGLISRLPIPLSVAACFIGIPLLIGRYRDAVPSLAVVLASAALMFVSLLVTTRSQGGEFQGKFIALLQFVLPMVALILGQLYETADEEISILSKVFLLVLCAIVLLLIYCSWRRGLRAFSPYLFVFSFSFSIYQHLQYVPVIFTGAFLIVLFRLGPEKGFRRWIGIFLPIMVLYVVVSAAVNAIILFALGFLLYLLLYERLKRVASVKTAIGVFLIIAIVCGYLLHFGRGESMLVEKFNVTQTDGTGGLKITGIQKRLAGWEFYWNGVTKDVPSFVMGNARLPDRSQYPSAHNYYLDFLYHFGFLPLVPLLVLIGATLYGVYRNRKEIIATRELLGLTIVVLFLLLVDNMLKVGLRQPYPGIFTFFLWGILISKLSVFSSRRVTAG